MAARSGSGVPSLGGRGGGWVAGQVVIGVFVVVFGLLGPPWPSNAVIMPVGAAIAAVGVILFLAGIGALGHSLTPLPKPKDDASLMERGAYRFVRHPIYGGVLLIVTGWSLIMSPLALVPTALLAGFLELKSRREEAWLVDRYAGYEAYRERVRWRFVPGIR
jgi:protein-S-isoprenylcysteine O-methyltransferase Ste14